MTADTVRVKGMGNAGTNGAASGDLVGRARVAAERLGGDSARGFMVLGIIAPFLILSAIAGSISVFTLLCLIPAVYGLFLVFRGGILHRPALWWKRAGAKFLSGFSNALFYALVAVWFMSCSTGLFMRPYYYGMLW